MGTAPKSLINRRLQVFLQLEAMTLMTVQRAAEVHHLAQRVIMAMRLLAENTPALEPWRLSSSWPKGVTVEI